MADDRDEGEVVFNEERIRLDGFLNLGEDRVPFGSEVDGLDDDGHGVDAGGDVLKGDVVRGEDIQHLGAEADLTVHHILFDQDGAEALMTGDAGNGARRGVLRHVRDDQRAGIFRVVGVADVDGDVRALHRENGVFMQDGGAHVGKLAQFAVGDDVDRARVVDDLRVRGEHAGDIGPVLVNIGVDSAGDNGAGDVGSAAGEGLDLAVGGRAVEAGDDRAEGGGQDFAQAAVGLVGEEIARRVEMNVVRGVDEFIADEGGEDFGVQVFAAAGHVIPFRGALQVLADDLNFGFQIEVQFQVFDDVGETLLDLAEDGFEVFAVRGGVIAGVEHVGDFGVA